LARALSNEGIDFRRYIRQVVLDPNFDPAGALLARSENVYAGFALAIARRVPLENAPMDSDRGYVTLFGVRPDERGKGVGTRLLQSAEHFLKIRGRSQIWISPYAPGYFTPGVDVAAYADGLRFLKHRGYEEAYRPLSMERSVVDYEMPSWVQQLAKARPLIWYSGERFDRDKVFDLLKFVSEVFPGDWVRIVRETMAEILAGDRPDRLQVAYDAAQKRVVGFSHYRAERFGPIGVHPDYRGQGIGLVLTQATLRAKQQAGYRTSWFLWTDDRTADRIYKPAGFQEVRRFAVLRKDL
jgi:GNAT superfamily N-acetyltransferase